MHHQNDKQNQAKDRKMEGRLVNRNGLSAVAHKARFERQRDCKWMRHRGHGTPKKQAEAAQ
jgi:hypothetical protein